MTLPSGTITFLFTDIEGSTRLWEEYPAAMRLALARHDVLIRQAIEANGGIVFKTIGDAFCAAFSTASAALNASLTAQCALHSEPWPEAFSLRARMALHTGMAEQRDNDYFGQPLNRVARLLEVAHGGQILLSDVTRELIRDTLPVSADLKNLGEHSLRDLGRANLVFQLLHTHLPAEFPPLRSLNNPALLNNLPQQVTSFIGRETQITEIKTLLGKARLLTLTGSGGCGKTRLSLQVAADALEQYPDGVWLVELAPLADPTLVPQTVAQTLNVAEAAGKPLLPTLVEWLKPKHLLLVMDNCEHLLDACAQLVNALLRSCPNIRVLASSRERLGIAGETIYRIPSLALPNAQQIQTAASLSQYEAIRLFVDRAVAVLPTFALTNANAAAVASVCHRLDGIPLALELAAARVRSLSVEEINTRLDNRFRLLTGGSRTALPRQQTLRALIDWSYDMLSAQEKAVLCRLAVFAGGWTLEASEAVCVGVEVEAWEVLDLLTSLVDKSLVVTESKEEHIRHRLLETVRQYARDRLAESGDGEAAHRQHQAFFVQMAEVAEPEVAGAEQVTWLNSLESEHDNLRAALEWGLYGKTLGADNKEAALRMAAALVGFWEVRGYYTEGRKWLADALASLKAHAPPGARAKALNAVGRLAHKQNDYALARALHEQSLALYQELGDSLGTADALMNLGNVAYEQCDYAAAHPLYEQSLALSQEAGNKRNIANLLTSLSEVAYLQGDYATFQVLQEQSMALFQELGNKQGIAYALMNLGVAARVQGDYATSRSLHERSLALYQELGNKQGIAYLLMNLGIIARVQANFTTAQTLQEQSIALFQELGDKQGVAMSLEAFAYMACAQEHLGRVAQLCGAAEALRTAIGCPLTLSEREVYNKRVDQARSAMDVDAFALAWAQGRSMTMEQAITYGIENADACLGPLPADIAAK